MSYPNKMHTLQKKLNQVKIMSNFRIFKPYKTEILLNGLDFLRIFLTLYILYQKNRIFAQKN